MDEAPVGAACRLWSHERGLASCEPFARFRLLARVVELVDAEDSKSSDLRVLRVRVSLRALHDPFSKEHLMRCLPAVVVVMVCAACASGSSSTSTSASPTSGGGAAASATVGRTLQANVVSTGSTTSRLSGTIILTPTDASTYRVEMTLRGGPNNKQLPWVIRPGSCGDATPNSELGSRSAYGPIQTHADGSATVNTSLHVSLPSGQQYHVDIMASPSQRDVISACGPLLAR